MNLIYLELDKYFECYFLQGINTREKKFEKLYSTFSKVRTSWQVGDYTQKRFDWIKENYLIERIYIIMQLGRKKFIFRVWNLMPEKSEGNNYTSEIDFSPVLHTIFFHWEVKNRFVCLARRKKCTFWPDSRKNDLFQSN